MFGLGMLDVLIGLMTVYFIFGITSTVIVEAISSLTRIRSNNLEAALSELFSGELAPKEQFLTKFYNHPLIQSLSKGKTGRPSYIPSEVVGQVVEALVAGKTAMSTLAEGVNSLPGTSEDNRIKGILETLIMQTGNDPDAFRKAVMLQFDAVMDRASGWYKRRTQAITLVVAALLVFVGNVDSINIAKNLASNSLAQESMRSITELTLDKQSPPDHKKFLLALESAGFAPGWEWGKPPSKPQVAGKQSEQPKEPMISKIIGLLITFCAVSLGGPFWFDILQRVVQIRSTGPKPAADADKTNSKST